MLLVAFVILLKLTITLEQQKHQSLLLLEDS